MSNTASAAFFLPITFGLAERAKISPAKLLMPMAFATILTSSVTLFSTSTNLVVSGVMQTYQMEPLGMFELAPVGIPIAIIGLVYLQTVGKRLIPDRFSTEEGAGSTAFKPYLAELIIQEHSPLVGKDLASSALGRDLDLKVIRIIRNKKHHISPRAETVFQSGDVLLVEGQSEEILRIKEISGIEIKADVKLSDPNLSNEDLSFVEVVLLPHSRLVGRTLKGFGFREVYDLQVIGVSRHGAAIYRKISDEPLRIGDILLVQGSRERIQRLHSESAFRVIGSLGEDRPKTGHAPLAIGIFLAVLALATFKVVSVPVAVMLGVAAIFLTRCISSDQAYRDLEWKAIILVACMLSLGAAMEYTGTASYLASLIVSTAGNLGPTAMLTGFFVMTVLLTQPMSNQAAAIVILPVAIQTALQLGFDPRPFAIMIAVAASCSYLTPLEPACLMVYGPGRYRFMDFLKVGAILTVLIYLVAILMVPRLWPLQVP